MTAKTSITLKQLRADLDTLSAHDFKIKYPGLSSKTLRGLTSEELEQRISKERWGRVSNMPGSGSF